jgi:hypothetical protein
MDKYDEYLRYAREAQELADHARNPDDKASWLRIAQSWLKLLPKRDLTLEDRFAHHVHERSTKQRHSDQSH